MIDVLLEDQPHSSLWYHRHVVCLLQAEEGCLSSLEASIEIQLKSHFADLGYSFNDS